MITFNCYSFSALLKLQSFLAPCQSPYNSNTGISVISSSYIFLSFFLNRPSLPNHSKYNWLLLYRSHSVTHTHTHDSTPLDEGSTRRRFRFINNKHRR